MSNNPMETLLKSIESQLAEISNELASLKTSLGTKIDILECSMKNQHLKLDCLSSINYMCGSSSPVTKAQKKDDQPNNELSENSQQQPGNANETIQEPTDNSKKGECVSRNITEYFKYIYMNNRDILFEKGILSKDECDKIIAEHTPAAGEKKKSDIVLQKTVATAIWKTLTTDKRDIVYALRNQNNNDIQKNKSKDIKEEDITVQP